MIGDVTPSQPSLFLDNDDFDPDIRFQVRYCFKHDLLTGKTVLDLDEPFGMYDIKEPDTVVARGLDRELEVPTWNGSTTITLDNSDMNGYYVTRFELVSKLQAALRQVMTGTDFTSFNCISKLPGDPAWACGISADH
jgi:hypothetical protein